ncbi:2-C-methyl-D-erythritol 4-phosphate cytidylyltransferase [Gottfriedia sp. NPDC056225]|uniref:2-C-methyl-D-erythritol 4-phosphate cytidylyltransferase n=1 Tax=Gottfriedia sp. NPDC056225 TaxID=3345751 RepID=UPI001559C579|nr:2-C-methyl-D-erythritol 4-phosphate cytidylyltransferase [Arthrobacter citreus]
MQYKVIIPAAGSGSRMGAGFNKLFIKIMNSPIIELTLKVFGEDERCTEIILPIKESENQFFETLNLPNFIKQKITFVKGGSERQESVYNGLDSIKDSESLVLVHDGARPFVTNSVINRILSEMEEHEAVICAVPMKDTIKKVVNQEVVETIDRSTLWGVQTPQAFTYKCLLEAHQKATQAGYLGTDDASLVEWNGSKVFVVNGDYNNIKVTTKEDLFFAETIYEQYRG